MEQGIGTMALVTLGSLNRKQKNFIKDVALIFSVKIVVQIVSAITVFSICGYLAQMRGTTMNDVMMSGLQLLFMMFPMAFANMSVPPLWSALFFLMILLLGFGQQLVFVESISLAIADNWPRLFGKKRLHLTLALCLALFLLGVTLCTGVSSFVLSFYCPSRNIPRLEYGFWVFWTSFPVALSRCIGSSFSRR